MSLISKRHFGFQPTCMLLGVFNNVDCSLFPENIDWLCLLGLISLLFQSIPCLPHSPGWNCCLTQSASEALLFPKFQSFISDCPISWLATQGLSVWASSNLTRLMYIPLDYVFRTYLPAPQARSWGSLLSPPVTTYASSEAQVVPMWDVEKCTHYSGLFAFISWNIIMILLMFSLEQTILLPYIINML